ncbi:MAG: hypothetical protein E7Z64_05290 [Thermoplasmata archaeon]|jgi:hypothetical protein|nr:hypothetical protein [Thermoplasmata archaeon]
MSYDAESIEKLTAMYESQSPNAFIAFAMEGLPQDNDHAVRFDRESDNEHGELSPCSYGCCNDRGCCATWKGYACLIGTVVVLVVCCWYVTDGFFSEWPFWPF